MVRSTKANVVVLVLLFSLCCSTAPALDPIYVGVLTSRTSSQLALKNSLMPTLDALHASFDAVNNKSGGIAGRLLVAVECECGSIIDNSKVTECAANFSRDYPQMVAWVTPVTDVNMPVLADRIFTENIFLVAPVFTSSQYRTNLFSRNWIFTSVDPLSRFSFGITQFVQKYHVKRVGIAQSSHVGFDVSGPRNILLKLGVQFTGVYYLDADLTGYSWRDEAYYNWLAQRPQVVFNFVGMSETSFEFFTDLITRSAKGNGVDPDLLVLSADMFLPVAELTLLTLRFQRISYDPRGRLYFSFGNPAMTDSRYTSMSRATAELNEYFQARSSKFPSTGTAVTMGAIGWIAAQVLIAILKKMDPSNISRHSIMDLVFNAGVFEVDDLLFGIYSTNCSGFAAAQSEYPCGCNEGYRTSESYGYDASIPGAVFPIPDLQYTTSISQCHTTGAPVVPHLVYLLLTANASSLASAYPAGTVAEAMALLEAGQTAQETVALVPSRATYERANITVSSSSSSTFTGGSIHATAAPICDDRYISAFFSPILDSNDAVQNYTNSSTGMYPVIDPLVFPAQLALPFANSILYVSATLQQELFAIAEYLSLLPHLVVHAFIRGPQASAMIDVITKSVETFGIRLASAASTASVQLPIEWGSIPRSEGGRVIVIGLLTATDVHELLSFLSVNPLMQVCVAFAELSVLYDSFLRCSELSVCRQIVFATSLRNWNAPQLANQSTLMMEYFMIFTATRSNTSGFNSSRATRHPLTLRGFVNSAAVRRVLSEITDAFLPQSILNKWYNTAVIALSTNDYIGPYVNGSSTSCAGISDQQVVGGGRSCLAGGGGVNVGASLVRVFAVADVMPADVAAPQSYDPYRHYTTFSGGVIPYLPLSSMQSRTLAPQTILIIALGSILCLLIVAAVYKVTTMRRTIKSLVSAGLGVVCVRVVIHILRIGVAVLSANAISSSSSSATFTAVFSFLTGLSALSSVIEMVVLGFYFREQTNAESELSEEFVLVWQVRIAQSALLTLGASDVPLIIMTFVALLRLRVSPIVLLSMAVSCYFAGTKFRFLKEVFADAARNLRRAANVKTHRRFPSLKSAVWFIIGARKLTGRFGVPVAPLTSDSSEHDLQCFRDVLRVTEPARLHNLRYRAKLLAAELHRCEISPGEFVSVVEPHLLKRYETEPPPCDEFFRGSALASAATTASTGVSFFIASLAPDNNVQMFSTEGGARNAN